MIDPQLSTIAPADLIAPIWFLACWFGYTLFADRPHRRPNLMQSMAAYRRLWMQRMLERDNRIVDSQIIGNLMRSASFFASTTLIIIGGLLAMLGAPEKVMAVLRDLPVAGAPSGMLWTPSCSCW
jgi:uncharacterized membrane protein